MSSEVKKEIQLEIAHVLFSDIVGYSKLMINEQRALRDTLTEIVRRTEEFQSADVAGKLIKIPTGDGMALVFQTKPGGAGGMRAGNQPRIKNTPESAAADGRA